MRSGAPLIHVVDDDDGFRTAIGRLLRASGYEVALYESADRFLEAYPYTGPGCILLDLRMTGSSGLELQERLAGLGNDLPVVFLTGAGDIPTSVQAIKAGAEDFLSKPVPKAALLEVVGRALDRYETARGRREQLGLLRGRVARLTPREKEVFALVVRGRLNKQIGYDLGASERTIKAHRQRIMEKLEVRSAAELASIAERLGMLDPVGPVD
jgi:FixJ family two-component response regulator